MYFRSLKKKKRLEFKFEVNNRIYERLYVGLIDYFYQITFFFSVRSFVIIRFCSSIWVILIKTNQGSITWLLPWDFTHYHMVSFMIEDTLRNKQH